VKIGVHRRQGRWFFRPFHHVDEPLQLRALLGGSALGRETRRRHLQVRTRLVQVATGVITHGQVGGDPIGNDEGSSAGMGFGQPESLAGTKRLADDGAAHSVASGHRRLRWQPGAHCQLTLLDRGAQVRQDRL
jgi:hypothetical protein